MRLWRFRNATIKLIRRLLCCPLGAHDLLYGQVWIECPICGKRWVRWVDD